MTSGLELVIRLDQILGETEVRKLIDSGLCTVHELVVELPADSLSPEWCETQLSVFLDPERIHAAPGILTVYSLRRPIKDSWGPGLVNAVLGTAPDYQAVCRSTAGTVTWLQEASRFCFQTPEDDAGLSYSFAATANEWGTKCVLVSPDPAEEIQCPPANFQGLGCSEGIEYFILLLIPLRLLQAHVAYTSSTLAGLTQNISKAEAQILDPSQLKDFDILIKDLHKYNADLLKLERRWRFERNLSATIRDIIETWKHGQEDRYRRMRERAGHVHGIMEMDDISMLQEKLSRASEYDLGVLPRRIQNQFTAVYNLMAQRDTKANMRLATDSQRLATASLRDSSSMKTIAGMTLIFLPPTFICSFFSMSFFNFEATGAKSIWIYFATAAPLTAVVTLSWLVYTSWRRKADERRFERKASSVHAV